MTDLIKLSCRQGRISVDEGLAAIIRTARRLPSERVMLDASAMGRVTAEAVPARTGYPRFDNAAMDGFALRSAETDTAAADRHIRLRIDAAVAAGEVPAPLAAGACAPISTGAMIPAGADAVIAREQAEAVDGCLSLSGPVTTGRNVRRSGEDATAGSMIAAAGTRLGPDVIAAMLACGVPDVRLVRAPRAAILSSGSELATDSGALPHAAAIADSNGPMLAAACAALGVETVFLSGVGDEREALGLVLQRAMASDADLLISTGGVSAGDHDLICEALQANGCRIVFHGLTMRPGKPILYALLPDGRPYFGLPGNPVAALVGFRFFVTAAIRAALGMASESGEVVRCDADGRAGTTLFLRATRLPDGAATQAALDQRSHMLLSVVRSNCWLRVDLEDDGSVRAQLFAKDARLLPQRGRRQLVERRRKWILP